MGSLLDDAFLNLGQEHGNVYAFR